MMCTNRRQRYKLSISGIKRGEGRMQLAVRNGTLFGNYVNMCLSILVYISKSNKPSNNTNE